MTGELADCFETKEIGVKFIIGAVSQAADLTFMPLGALVHPDMRATFQAHPVGIYAHVFAWQRALAEEGMPIDGWRIHRRIGMSGGLFVRAAARELGVLT